MKFKITKENLTVIILSTLLFLAVLANSYFIYQNYRLKNKQANLESQLALLEDKFNVAAESLGLAKEDLQQTEAERNSFQQKYQDEKTRVDVLALQISSMAGTVGFLERLSQTDPQLLQKYSKVYFLNENYVPEELASINPDYTFNPEKGYLFYAKTLPFLNDLMQAAQNDKIDLEVISAFRSFSEQSALKSSYKMTYGSGANQFSADQGYSEHQLGTTVDFTTSEVGASYTDFEKTAAYQWLLDNAYKYGFVLSYPDNNEYYQFEPWHWRFVSRGLALELHKQGKNFYDLDQREINSFLVFFFD